jgi:hypothetical protein
LSYLDLCAMKYICVLLSSIALASCSGSKVDDLNKIEFKNGNDEKATFNHLRYDMIRHIATFIEPEDIVNWRYVNCLTLSSLTLKKLVEQIFNMSGLECIADNEPELAGVLRLVRISHDPFLLFKFLINDVVKGKKPYDVLFSALILHLFKTFPELGAREKQECQLHFERKFKNNVESYMIIACLNKGHFDLVLEIVKDNAFLSGKALESAARLGHTNIVELLLQSRADIPANYIFWALEYASEIGHIPVVERLLQIHTDLPYDSAIRRALFNAAKGGHLSTVKYLLQSRTDLTADDVGGALRAAAYSGHIPVVELLFQCRTDIPANDVGWAICSLAESRNLSIVELIADDFCGALRIAAYSGLIPVVELLLQCRVDISADHVGDALEKASEGGHTPIVELLLQRRNICFRPR